MGMFEYGEDLADAISPTDMQFVANAYRAGQSKSRDEIWNKLEPLFGDYNNLYIDRERLRAIIYG
jgi:hypothetical protein